VAVVVSPDAVALGTGAEQAFTAAVTGSAVTTVTWTVREGTPGGTVSTAGFYTAPGAAGSYHVVATSDADPSVSAVATVTVATPATVAVAVSPATRTLAAGASTTFTASVAGSADTAVAWSVREASCGAVTAAGVYTAPSAAAACHVVATSHADPTKTASATVTVTATAPPPAVAVTVTPGTAAVNGCQTATLSATVTGTSNSSVTWSVVEAAGGTVSGGVYTAPSTAGTYHVVATSQADATRSATATMTVGDKVLSVALSPATLSLAPGATGQFTATVTTTCGTVSALRTVTAPLN
jgi:hypothetical protein